MLGEATEETLTTTLDFLGSVQSGHRPGHGMEKATLVPFADGIQQWLEILGSYDSFGPDNSRSIDREVLLTCPWTLAGAQNPTSVGLIGTLGELQEGDVGWLPTYPKRSAVHGSTVYCSILPLWPQGASSATVLPLMS